MNARFYVSEMHGYPLDPNQRSMYRPSNRDPAPLIVSVHDRIYCHRTIRSWEPRKSRLPRFGASSRREREAWARSKAAELCAELNAKHEAWLTS